LRTAACSLISMVVDITNPILFLLIRRLSTEDLNQAFAELPKSCVKARSHNTKQMTKRGRFMINGGYTGKVLRVNLSTKKISVEELSEQVAQDFMGGAGFGIKYLYDEVPGNVDPLGEENKLIFASGPLTGTSVPCNSRMTLTTKSPLTGTATVALSGGYFPVELKFAGYDVLIIEGKSETPVYLYINDDKVSIRSAEKLWGMDTVDTQLLVKHMHHDQNVRVACIGPAGENLSKMASVINERRAFGRRGVGAVMGSKNLKAIAVRGTKSVPIANETAFKSGVSAMLGAMKASPVLYPEFAKHGTPLLVDGTSAAGIFPSENFRNTGEKDYVTGLGIETSSEAIISSEQCYRCPVSCSQLKLAKGHSKYAGALSDPEYETYFSLGSQNGVDDLDVVIAADALCDRVGLDTISTGVTIGFAMELFERGILTLKDTGGVELKFGNHEAMMDLIKEIAYKREGLGALLSDGCKVAAEKVGQGSSDYAMHCKGLEFPAYDPRGAMAHGLNYATSFCGADHNKGYAIQEIFGIPVPKAYDRFAIEEKGWLTKWNQDVSCAVSDCPTVCAFVFDIALAENGLQNIATLVNAATGFNLTAEDVQKVGERVNNLGRVFNITAGFSRADDTMPERIFTEPIKAGTSKGHYIKKEDFNKMLDDYYVARNWTKDGIPTAEKLEELGIGYALENLGQ